MEVLRFEAGGQGRLKFKSLVREIEMRLIEDFARFADELRKSPHGLLSEISFFPSGAVSMRIRSGSRLFDLDYFPSESRFCVDELPDDAGFNTGYRFSFSDFDAAKAKMLNLLDGANGERAAAMRDPTPATN